MQRIAKLEKGVLSFKNFPNQRDYVLPGIKWGRVDQLLTPGFWAAQAWINQNACNNIGFRLGKTLKEEIAVCLLGGYGMRAELGLAAFERIRNLGYLEEVLPSSNELLDTLKKPFDVCGHKLHYRFAKRKSVYLYDALAILSTEKKIPADHRQFRAWLLEFKGIGPKTASWITRNWFASNDVAIIDIHIFRAGLHMGIFQNCGVFEKNYFNLEEQFLRFANKIDVKPSILDSMMWSYMRRLSRVKFV